MMFTRLRAPIITLFNNWAERRRPKGRSVLLNQKRIFILPTLAGWGFLVLCTTMFLIGVNYQNNLIHALAFLLIALGVLSILYTFLNLSGLRISAHQAYSCHAGEMAEFCFRIGRNNGRQYEGVNLSLPHSETATFSLIDEDDTEVKLFVVADTRGYFDPGAVHISTIYPFGLLKAWSWVKIEQQALIYPKPIKGPAPQLAGEGKGYGEHRTQGDDFYGLKEYRPGMSTKHIAWKQFAQGRGVFCKNYVGREDKFTWLCWDDWHGFSDEHRLSVICYWALRLERSGERYGLNFPRLQVNPASGQVHLQKVLSILACYGQEGDG